MPDPPIQRAASVPTNNLELIDIFYATADEHEIARREATKLAVHIQGLSPGFAVEIKVFHGIGERKSDAYGEGRIFGVYNSPRRHKSCSITIAADDEWIHQGVECFGFFRGDNEAHVRATVLTEQGERSVETLVHEWLHYFAPKKWNINPDDQSKYAYTGSDHDCAANGWRFWYAALLGAEMPMRLIA
jgi:hypothetical protein